MSLSLRLQHETLNRWRGGGGDDAAAPLLFGGICLQKQKATFKPVVYVPVMPEGEKIWGASSNRGSSGGHPFVLLENEILSCIALLYCWKMKISIKNNFNLTWMQLSENKKVGY